MAQDVLSAHLVVEQVEAVIRLCLGLAIELPLKDPDLFWCCGVASSMLANLYMNRFLKHWRKTGRGKAFRALSG